MSVKRNLVSNFIGSSATALILLLVTPVYLRYLGPEAFGLVGVFVTLTGIATLLDMGLTPALTRELAILSATGEGTRAIRSTVRTLELIYFAVALLALAIAYQAVPLLGVHWLKPSGLSTTIVKQCLELMTVQLALQLPLSFYTGGLIGMQKQGLMNAVNTMVAAVRAIGAVVLLIIFHADVVSFFIWQSAITGIHLFVMGLSLWMGLPPGASRFRLDTLRRIWRYAAGMVGITALSILLTQLDKIILSRTLSLEHFGYYMLAWNMASMLLKPAGPVFNAWLPRMTQLASLGSTEELALLYRKGAQLLNLLVVPAAILVSIFSYQVLYLYTGSTAVAEATATALILLCIGSACNALMHIPYALTLAYGWTQFAIVQNILSSLIVVPITYWASTSYGLNGGGLGWCLVNILYVLFSLYFIHRRYLKAEFSAWYLGNITLYLSDNFRLCRRLLNHQHIR
jgi:O-antigen/teichoic acid export membrane protein